ncbi:PREDICTED: STE20-related kinase adapter protein alpha-like isoform X4 [Priapulus caudatus]|uniref:STE20-related kinase adapter protein alpha-like isoform X3 n=1 Tax=Priapulus caudatus TaxID=37621 RepID=A0ABM1FBJ2_PRICU|nr:PREDICTED: STE20-related kinase adapter protein alpha-like isoform X3 [Priapulus caudatus]XP_014681813.1 PREDICTED: STE20-related kinase adapter protein alpha-like isoform X4 [Priapulus caudatus]
MSLLCYRCLPCFKTRVSVSSSKLDETESSMESFVKLQKDAGTILEAFPLLPLSVDRMNQYRANVADYELKTVIGRGFSGATTISLARHRPSKSLVAVRKTNLELSAEDVLLVQNEITVTRQLSHPNLLPYYCTIVINREVWTIAPVMAYGSVQDLIHAHFHNGLHELAISLILRDVLKGLDYLHHLGYVHRSIKASHILISLNGKACLTGLRSSISMIRHGVRLKRIHDFPRSQIETNMYWLSSQILSQNLEGYGPKSDMYSLGITACEMGNGCVPFQDMAPSQMLLEKSNGTMPRLLDSTTVDASMLQDKEQAVEADSIPNLENDAGPSGADKGSFDSLSSDQAAYKRTFSCMFHQFVEACLHRNPSLRPTAAQLFHHAFIKQVRKLPVGLPVLLSPVKPLKDADPFPNDMSGEPEVDAVTETMENLEIETWDF